VATVYPRFPTRAGLIAGAFEAKIAAYADAVTQALTGESPANLTEAAGRAPELSLISNGAP
jgi:hypothetical protein